MIHKKDRINIILKPTNYCNMRCIYCFHQDSGYEDNIISSDCVTKLFELLAQSFYCVSILWHGGEPTCVGIKRLQEFIDIQNKISKKYQVPFLNAIQTNLTNIDAAWLRFFIANNFSLGTSFDGLCNTDTRKNTDVFWEKRELCLKYGYNIGAICVVSHKIVFSLIENYEWFKQNRFSVNFNPYITDNKNDDLYVSVEDYIYNIIELFEYWIYDRKCNIHVNPFENLLYAYFKHEYKVCTFGSCLSHWACIEPNGDIFPCDKSFNRNFCYGNINLITDFNEIYNSEGYRLLIKQAIERRDACIAECKWFQYCHGGCNHDAFMCGNIAKIDHYYCKIYKALFEFLEKMSHKLINDTKTLNPMISSIIA